MQTSSHKHNLPADLSPSKVIGFYDPEDAWGWLANYSHHQIVVRGQRWETVEHYFQAQKFAGTWREKAIQRAESPASAKEQAKMWCEEKRPDWKTIRLPIMCEAVRSKFTQHPDLGALLLATGDTLIVENAEDDRFWGRDRGGDGLNVMGVLLMALRAELRPDKSLAI
ncbi:MAG: NADAR family protein [Candidatus Sumerlaeota bacterium]|nr:NADAR family protein [Candidatus Sumerlaeota bacterium]